MQYEKDLVILVPDKNVQFLVDGLLSKAPILGMRQPTHQLDTHPLRDYGCLDADELLESQATRYAYALVVANRERSGRSDVQREAVEAEIEGKLARSGWGQRARAVVVDPGIGRWLLEHNFGEKWSPGTAVQRKLEAALRRRRIPQSPELYRALGARMVEVGEPDPAWQKIVSTLSGWFRSPGAAPNDESLRIRFESLVEEWLRDTILVSSFSTIITHPAYQEIIRMGDAVVPLILRDLEREPKHWGPALRAITGAQPVPSEHAGRVREIAKDWLHWAKNHGYVW